jgi:hypothetical protein
LKYLIPLSRVGGKSWRVGYFKFELKTTRATRLQTFKHSFIYGAEKFNRFEFIYNSLYYIKYTENILNMQSKAHDRQPFTKSCTHLKKFNLYRADNSRISKIPKNTIYLQAAENLAFV